MNKTLQGCVSISTVKEGRISLERNIHMIMFRITSRTTFKKKQTVFRYKIVCRRLTLQQGARKGRMPLAGLAKDWL